MRRWMNMRMGEYEKVREYERVCEHEKACESIECGR